MKPPLLYRVTADHGSPDYQAYRKEVTVHEDHNGRFYANAAPYGCGQSARTPEGAIRALLADNGCTRIDIEACEKRTLQIVVQGGCVVEVQELPEDWDYEIIDLDDY